MRHYIQEIDTDKAEDIKPIIVEKEWGQEEHIHNNYHCVKLMRLKPGYQVSLHWHEIKEETFILISGKLVIETINPKTGQKQITLLTEPLESFTLGKNIPHTFYCTDTQRTETVFIEASTPDNANDSYRIFSSGKRE